MPKSTRRSAELGKAAVLQNIQGTLEFLSRFPPFDQMPREDLIHLVEHCLLRFYPRGESIILPEEGVVEHFHIVKQGRVHGERLHDGKTGSETTFEISVGECFPLAALIGERATRTRHIAATDTFCLLLPRSVFMALLERSPPLREFALRGVSTLLDQANQQAQLRAAEQLGSQFSLDMPLQRLVAREPLCCRPETLLRRAVRHMHEAHVGSMVVVDERLRPLGIFTLRDLRRVVAEGLDLDQPISRLMTPAPYCLATTATAFDAALAMAERHIAHICLLTDERLVGVVSERDLFALQRVDLVNLARAIRQAETVDALVSLRDDIHQLVERMLAHGASSTQITRLITQLNDHTVCRVIELTLEDMGDPGVPFVWLGFGSEGRCEQTLHTDQDNGILFEADDAVAAAEARGRLLPFAEAVNQRLAQCGFTLCKGEVMARNPALCLSRHEWERRFTGFVLQATPENLLASTIYFDLRALWGDERSCERLREHLLALIADNPLFQRMMAENALRQRPPVGRFRNFVVARSGADKDTLDLKVQGLTPFVDAARVLALAHSIKAGNTLERLHALVALEVIEAQDGAAYEEAYHFIQQTRMQLHQQQAREGLPYSNRLAPDTLNLLDRRILREAFRQAVRLQTSLAVRYQL